MKDVNNGTLARRSRRNPIREMFDSFPFSSSLIDSRSGASSLRLNIYRDDANDVVVEASVPGCDEDDVNVTLDDQTLTIETDATETYEDEHQNWSRREIQHTSSSRSIRLPDDIHDDDVDDIDAKLNNGILIITFPAEGRDEESGVKQIDITPT